jgi:hypothetical protein
MPEKTADDLARILSLASSSTPRGTWNANEAAGPAAGPAPPAPGPLFRPERPVEPGVPLRDFSPGLMGSLFYDFGSPGSEEREAAGGARPRFNSKDSKVAATPQLSLRRGRLCWTWPAAVLPCRRLGARPRACQACSRVERYARLAASTAPRCLQYPLLRTLALGGDGVM